MGLRSARAPIAVLALASIILFLLVAVLASDARSAWIDPVGISPAGVASTDPQIAVDAAGNLTAAWTSGAEGSREIRSASRPAGGPWEPSVSRISSAGVNCEDPRLAVSPSGATVLVADCGTGSATMRAAYRPASGAWSASVGVPGSGAGAEPRVDIDDSGNAVMVWSGTAASTVQSAYRAAGGGWVADPQVSPAGAVTFEPNVAIGPTGVAHAVWRRQLGAPVISVETIRRQGGGAWEAVTLRDLTLEPSATSPIAEGEPQIQINAGSDRMAAWTFHAVGGKEGLQERTAGLDLAAWGEPPVSLGESPTADMEEARIAIDGQGRAIATWRSFGAAGFLIRASTTAFINGSWSSPATLAGPSAIAGGTKPQVAASPAGDANVVWRALDGVVSAARRAPGGAFGAATPISNATHPGFGEPQVTMDATGDAIATWSSDGTSPAHIAVAIDDVTPPTLGVGHTTNVPAGTQVIMQATVSDIWSGVAGVAWDFGDGATATGTQVTHAYASAGGRTVTVSATDGVGNTVTQTFEVTIIAGPTGGPGGSAGPGSGAKEKVRLSVAIPKQRWKKIKRAKAIRLLCGLDLAGSCSVTAAVTRQVAKRLGLKLRKGTKTATVGSGSVAVKGGDEPGTLKARLSGKARKAIDAATKPVPIVLTVNGSAAGRESATLSRTLRIKRP